jgi:hypothetical protein
MSCFNNNCYLPRPPRAWSRVQNACTDTTDYNGFVKDPYTGEIIPSVILAERIAMLNKGNVLQYKANSSNLTKAQKYSKIAKGQWVNRNTTWATQNARGYTNPNTTSLKRAGNVTNIAIDQNNGTIIGPTTEPVTCPQTFDPNKPIVIQDGGVLICSVQENVCTGYIKTSIGQQLCHPTSDSDVPGTIRELCWNDGTQTWYPRQRYIMTNSSNKWPVNAELVGAIKMNAPIIISGTNNENTITLNWTFDNSCLSASNFIVFQNGIPVKTVPGDVFTTEIVVRSDVSNYDFYIIAENTTGKTVSDKSNTYSFIFSTTGSPTIT